MTTEAETSRFTIWACESCDQRLTVECEDAEAFVLDAVARGTLVSTHRCTASGRDALGVTRLLGACSPGWYPGKPYRTETAA